MDADVAAVLESWAPVQFDDPAAQRALIAAARQAAPAAPPDPDVVIASVLVDRPGGPPVSVRTYHPAACDDDRGSLVWFHGGAYCIGSAEYEDSTCSQLSKRTGATVVSVDYRLAPEDPFPAGFDDCVHVVEQVAAGALEGVPAGPVAVGGASAGAGLAAATAHFARDNAGPELVFQLLLYPFLDDRLAGASFTTAADAVVFNARDARVSWAHYLGADRTTVSPYAAPARATDLSGLPPAYVLAAGLDCLRDDAVDYALGLMRAGGTVELHVLPTVPHGFLSLAPEAPISVATQAEIVSALANAFDRSRPARQRIDKPS